MTEVTYTPIQMEIARQIHNAKPDGLVPGRDVGFEPLGEDSLIVRLAVEIRPGLRVTSLRVVVTYDHGRDDYDVRLETDSESKDLDRVYCDQLGELIFGEDAKPWDEPMGAIITEDADGNLEIREF
jgi:hypothetical protein